MRFLMVYRPDPSAATAGPPSARHMADIRVAGDGESEIRPLPGPPPSP
jgi:hypothetical protein